jgi:ribosomal protein S17E
MNMVQLLLPLWSNSGERFRRNLFDQVTKELMDRFSGLTTHTQAPASGLWEEDDGKTIHDEIIIYEVMVESLDLPWWSEYRRLLETRFEQNKLIIRAYAISIL